MSGKKRLPDSAFADPVNRVISIVDEAHTRVAVLVFSAYVRDDGTISDTLKRKFSPKHLKIFHDRIFERAKKFGIKHAHSCELCKTPKEKVIFT